MGKAFPLKLQSEIKCTIRHGHETAELLNSGLVSSIAYVNLQPSSTYGSAGLSRRGHRGEKRANKLSGLYVRHTMLIFKNSHKKKP